MTSKGLGFTIWIVWSCLAAASSRPDKVGTLSQPPHRFIPWEPAFHDNPVLHSSVQLVSAIPSVWNEASAPDVDCGEISRGSATHHENLRICDTALDSALHLELACGSVSAEGARSF